MLFKKSNKKRRFSLRADKMSAKASAPTAATDWAASESSKHRVTHASAEPPRASWTIWGLCRLKCFRNKLELWACSAHNKAPFKWGGVFSSSFFSFPPAFTNWVSNKGKPSHVQCKTAIRHGQMHLPKLYANNNKIDVYQRALSLINTETCFYFITNLSCKFVWKLCYNQQSLTEYGRLTG